MHKRSVTMYVFGILLFLSVSLWVVSKVSFLQPIEGIVTFFTAPLQQMSFSLFHLGGESDELSRLRKENARLVTSLVDQKRLIAEDNALRDQFKINKPTNTKLLPASVIGARGFIPGVSQPEVLVLNVGKKQGVFIGQAVVVNNNLIGSIETVSYTLATVTPIQYLKTPFPARSLETNAVGLVVRTDAGGLQFGNVLLSDTLKKDDFVVTNGTVEQTGKGFPPDIIVGKIADIDKKSSALFQGAKVLPLMDLSKLTTVFLVSY